MDTPIKHIFFDLDHTLWDFDKNSFLAFEMMFKKHDITLPVDDFLKVYRPINLKYWKLYREEQVSKTVLRRGRFLDVFEQFDLRFPLAFIDTLAEDYIQFLPMNNHLIDGAEDLLHYLYPKYTLHIITNGFREVQERKLISSGIRKYFQTITNSEDAGVKKPNPIIFDHAIKVSGASVAQSMMIGDNFEADIQGAESFGMKTIFFNYHKDEMTKNYTTVSDLRQIKMLINS